MGPQEARESPGARRSHESLRERARRLYEREGDTVRLRQYVLRWWWWHLGGLDGMVSRKGGLRRIERLVFHWLDIHLRRGTVTAGGA